MLIARRVLIFAALWLLFEGVISWFATCEPPSKAAANYGSQENHCTFFGGPALGVTHFGAVKVFHFLHAYEKQLVAGFTIVLAFSTVLLWWSTRNLWAVTKISAEHIPNVERARLYVVMKSENIASILRRAAQYDHPTSGDMRLGEFQIHYCFKNYGKTPAFIRHIGQRAVLSQSEPQTIAYSMLVPLPVEHVLGDKDVTRAIKNETFPTMFTRDAVAIRDHEMTFWFCGFVEYDDAFGNRWELRFKWHYSAVSGGFTTYSYTEEAREK